MLKYGVFEGRTFKREKFSDWLIRNNIPWPRLELGTLDLQNDTFKETARIYPAVAPLRELRFALSQRYTILAILIWFLPSKPMPFHRMPPRRLIVPKGNSSRPALWLCSMEWVQNPINWILVIIALTVHHKIILAEELSMRDRFGERWTAYCNSVRRYL